MVEERAAEVFLATERLILRKLTEADAENQCRGNRTVPRVV